MFSLIKYNTKGQDWPRLHTSNENAGDFPANKIISYAIIYIHYKESSEPFLMFWDLCFGLYMLCIITKQIH